MEDDRDTRRRDEIKCPRIPKPVCKHATSRKGERTAFAKRVVGKPVAVFLVDAEELAGCLFVGVLGFAAAGGLVADCDVEGAVGSESEEVEERWGCCVRSRARQIDRGNPLQRHTRMELLCKNLSPHR